MSERALSIWIHGAAKIGKTTLATTSPTPMLFLDAENSSRFLVKPDGTRFRKVTWNPLESGPPAADGTWDLCIVKVNEWPVALKIVEHLRTNNHQFKSLVLDSVTELQYNLKKSILGGTANAMKMQEWGRLLQSMGAYLRDIRDLTADPASPLEAVVLLSGSKTVNGTEKPLLEGQVSQQVPYFYDITGYLYVNQVADANGEVKDQRNLLTTHMTGYDAGNRVHYSRDNGKAVIENPNISEILDDLFGPEESDN